MKEGYTKDMTTFLRHIAVLLIIITTLLICAGMAQDKDSIYNNDDSDNSLMYNPIENNINNHNQYTLYENGNKRDIVPVTEEERIMMYYIVEMEAHSLSFYHKQLISCVILNRVDSDLFKESSIYEVLTAKNQFSSLFNFYEHRFEPDSSTIQAVDSVLYGTIQSSPYEFSKGALFFYNPDIVGYKQFFENRPFLYEIEGHRFFA